MMDHATEELLKYEMVNAAETFEQLALAIEHIGRGGTIQGRTEPFLTHLVATCCRNFEHTAPNTLTRRYGIRQQALYLKHYGKK